MNSYLRKSLRPYKRHFVFGPLLKMVESVFELLLPLYMARIIDEGIRPRDTGVIYSLGLQMFLIISVSLLCTGGCQYLASIASQGFGTRARNALFAHVNRLTFSDLDKLGVNTLTTRVTNDINQLQVAVAMMIRQISRAPFISVGCIIMAMLLNQSLSVIIIVGVVSFVAVLSVIMVAALPLYSLAQKRLDGMSGVLRESFAGVRVIRAFNRVSAEVRRFVLAVDAHRDSVVRVAKVSSFMNPATMLIMNLLICAILWFGGTRVNAGGASDSLIVAFINYVGLILSALLQLASVVIIFTKSAASLARVNEVFAIPVKEEVVPAQVTEAIPAHGETDAADRCGEGKDVLLSFSDVSFSYTGNPEQNVLEDICFSLRKGECLGIIGGTGSGKSTVLSLLLRFYVPQSGRIVWGGTDVGSLDSILLRERMAVVFQNPRLFSGSIRENLEWSRPGASDEEAGVALERAQAQDFVNVLPEGYDARVERGGVNFSGGQRQRLSIARALVRKPELLLLDDASSALDFLTEAKLRRAIDTARREDGMSAIVVSQRINSVRFAEQILVLHEGRQVGLGTHEELLHSCEEYRAIALSQLSEDELLGMKGGV